MADFDYIITVGTDTDAIAQGVRDALNKLDDEATLKIKCDDSDVKHIIKNFDNLSPEITANIKINGKSLQKIKKEIQSNVNDLKKEFDSLNLDKARDELDKLQKRATELNQKQRLTGIGLSKKQLESGMYKLTEAIANGDDLSNHAMENAIDMLLRYRDQYIKIGGELSKLPSSVIKKIGVFDKQGRKATTLPGQDLILTQIENVLKSIHEQKNIIEQAEKIQNELNEYAAVGFTFKGFKQFDNIPSDVNTSVEIDTSQAEENVENLRLKINNLLTENAKLSAELAESRLNLSPTISSEEYDDAIRQIDEYETKLKESYQHIESLQNSLNTRLANLSREEDRNMELEDSLLSLDAYASKLSDSLDEANAQLELYAEQIYALENIKDIDGNFEEQEKTIVKLQEEIESLNVELNHFKDRFDNSVSSWEYDELEASLETLREKYEQLEQVLGEVQNENDDLKSQNSSMTNYVLDIKDTIEILSESLIEAEKRIAEYKQHLNDIHQSDQSYSEINTPHDIDKLISTLKELQGEIIKVREILNTVGTGDSFSALFSSIENIDSALIGLKSVFVDVGDGEEFAPLFKVLNNIIEANKELKSSISGIKFNLNLDLGSIDEKSLLKIEGRKQDLLRAYKEQFVAMKDFEVPHKKVTSTLFGDTSNRALISDFNKSILLFDDSQFDNIEQKIKAYESIINRMKEVSKLQYGSNVYDDMDIRYQKQVTQAKSNLSRAMSSLNKDSKELDNLFGKVDLTGVIGQLDTIIDKLDTIVKEAQNFKSVLTTNIQFDQLNSALKNEGSVVDRESDSEIGQLNVLKQTVEDVTTAVNNKTEAFQNEGTVVGRVIDDELTSLGTLWGTIVDVIEDVKNLTKSFEELNNTFNTQVSDNSIFSSLDNILQKKDELSNVIETINTEEIKTNETQNKIGNKKSLSSQSSKNLSSQTKDINEYISALEKYYKLKLKQNKNAGFTAIDKEQMNKALSTIDEFENKMKSLQKEGKILTKQQIDALELRLDYEEDIEKQLNESFRKSIKIDDIENQFKFLSSDNNNKSGLYSKQIDLINQKIDELKSKLPLKNIVDDNERNDVINLTEEIKHLIKEAKTSPEFKLASETSKSKLGKDITSWMSRNSAAAKAFSVELNEILIQLNALDSTADVSRLADQFNQLQMKASLAGKTGISFGEKMINRFKDLAAYLLSFASFYDIINIGRQAITIVTELDDALTEMRKVSDEPLSVLKEYQKASFDISDDIGTTSEQLQQSTADWMRLGESLTEAQKSAQDSIILKNVSEFDSIDAATESLVAMSQAYRDLDKIEIIDKLNNIGNNFSISTDDLATALQKSAAVLQTQGNDINEAIALITAGNAIGQDSDSTAAGIRTISLRIAGTETAKKELEELGESVDDYVVQTKSKTDELIRSYTSVASNKDGVSVLDDQGNLRDTFNILLDISKVYKEIQEEDKKFGTNRASALVEALAGKNRSNIAASILQNGDLLEEVYNTSLNSQGSAQQELDKYLDSVTGKTEQLKNRLQELASITINSEDLKIIIDLLSSATSLVTELVDNFGAFNLLLGTAGGILATKSGFGKIVVYNAPFYKVA